MRLCMRVYTNDCVENACMYHLHTEILEGGVHRVADVETQGVPHNSPRTAVRPDRVG